MNKEKSLKIYCFGNEFFEKDSITKKIADLKIDNIEFVKCNNPEDILDNNENKIIILDVIRGINKIQLLTIDDLDRIKTNNKVTAHDLDLGFYLKLYKELGKLKKKEIKIIGIPFGEGNVEKVKNSLIRVFDQIKPKHLLFVNNRPTTTKKKS